MNALRPLENLLNSFFPPIYFTFLHYTKYTFPEHLISLEMKHSHIALCSWFHPTAYTYLPKLHVKFTSNTDREPCLSSHFPPTQGYKSGQYQSCISEFCCTGRLEEDVLSVTSIYNHVMHRSSSEQYLDAIHLQHLTNLLHHDPNSELISFTDLASSAEPPTNIKGKRKHLTLLKSKAIC